ncbi:MAG: hypothetical protein Q7N50_16075 [Armatimonadota bacterium]|nr:hypothetical protein [Armatimonadota bacterium]
MEKEDGDIVMYRGTRKNIKEIDVAAHDPYYSNSGWAHFIDCKVNPSELKEDNLRFLDMLADVVPYSTRAICTAASSDTTTAMLNDLGIKTPVWVIGAEELVKLKYAKWKNLDLVFKENIGRDTIDSGDDLNEAS